MAKKITEWRHRNYVETVLAYTELPVSIYPSGFETFYIAPNGDLTTDPFSYEESRGISNEQ